MIGENATVINIQFICVYLSNSHFPIPNIWIAKAKNKFSMAGKEKGNADGIELSISALFTFVAKYTYLFSLYLILK